MGGDCALTARHFGKQSTVLVLCLLTSLLLALQWPNWPASLANPLWSVALYDRQQQLLDVSLAADEQWRLSYQQSTLPSRYQRALLLFEDQYFFQHPGINPLAIGRALSSNLLEQRVVSGASTLTMQLARLSYGKSTRSLWQKSKEAWLALCLEWHYSKDDILRMYAANAPFGGNIVGLQSASWWYFGREPAALSWSEAALLAVLPNNPGALYPGRSNQALKQKRDQLLKRLATSGAMSELDFELAVAEPLPQRPRGWPHAAPHLLAQLKKQYPEQSRFDTTLDGALQRQTAQALARHSRFLDHQDVHNIATLIVDHQQMQVLAYHGNVTQDAKAGAHVDITRSPRSSGSILKPFLYAAQLDAGLLLPTSLQADVRSQFGSYSPANFDLQFRGAVPAQQALAESLNIPAVRQLASYGVTPFKDDLLKLGLSSIHKSADHYGLSLILGGAETRLTELTQAYAAMAHAIAQQRRDVPTLQYLQQQKVSSLHLPFSVGAAYLTLDALTQVERPDSEGSWRDYSQTQTIAWKTGTSFGLRDAWAIGSNGQYTIGVWVGNADGHPAPVLTGGQSAGPVLFDLFRQVPTRRWLAAPLYDLATVEVCKADGFPARLDCEQETTQKPKASTLQLDLGYMQQLWLDPTGRYQLPQGCVAGIASQPQTRLVLPLAMAWYYQRRHPDYRPLPDTYPGCPDASQESIAILAPVSVGSITLPLQGDGKLGAAVFRAVTRDPHQSIDWHLAGRYLGRTRAPHQMAIQAPSGHYELVLTASDGQRLTRQLHVVRAEFANASATAN